MLRTRFPLPSVIHVCFKIVVLLLATTSILAPQTSTTSGQRIDRVLRDAVARKRALGVVAMVAVGDKVVYEGAAGKRDTKKDIPITVDSIFRIASMTKPVTSVAVMQLVENGQVKLDESAVTYLPELAHVQVVDAFNSSTGKATLRAPKTLPTVRQLLSHTSGFAYEFFDPELHRMVASGAVPSATQADDAFMKSPLMTDPGSRWEYGVSTDWLARLVEKVSGQNLEDYFHQHIFAPLGMEDTFYNVPLEKQARVVPIYQRQDDGTFVQSPPQAFKPVRSFSGGGGLYSTASDYLKFERMLLNGGKVGKVQVLRPETVQQMSHNQIGDLNLTEMRSVSPTFARDPVNFPGSLDKFGLGLAINTKPVAGGRAAGSMAWAGIFNTFFWIDPSNKTCTVILMQVLPFSNDAAVSVVEDFEHAVYASPALETQSAGTLIRTSAGSKFLH